MPSPSLKVFAKKAGTSVERAEKLWKKAKKLASNAGKENDYAYITGIVKKMLKVENAIEATLEGESFNEAMITDHSIQTFIDEAGRLRFATLDDVLLENDDLMEVISEVYESASTDSGIPELLDGYEGPIEILYLSIAESFDLAEFVRTAMRPRKRRFSKLGAAFNPITGKRKDPHKRVLARKVARKGRAKRKVAARKFARSAKGKLFHKKLGKLVARVRRH